MKKLLLLALLVPFHGMAQINTSTQDTVDILEEEEPIFMIVEEMPEYPGGQHKMHEFVARHTNYPSIARDNGVQGTVYVSFIIDRMGRVREPKILRGIGYGCDEEALRVVKLMPNWKPGHQLGKAVKVRYNLPVKFRLVN